MPATEPPPTSAGLLRRLAGAATAADWAVFLERYTPLIDARCRRAGLQPADVEDLRGAVLARMVRALRSLKYDPARRFRGYITRVADNALRSHWKALAARPGAVGRGGEDHLPEPLARLTAELDDGIRDHLDASARAIELVKHEVGAEAWAAFWLTAMGGLSGAEAAATTGTTPAAVYTAKSRVLARLRAALRPDLPHATEESADDAVPD